MIGQAGEPTAFDGGRTGRTGREERNLDSPVVVGSHQLDQWGIACFRPLRSNT
jgi:hypothetical protein